MSEHENSPEEETVKKKPARKRWFLKAFGISCLVIFVLGTLLNGSLGRRIIKDQVSKLTEEKELKGDFTLSGTLLGGYTLSGVSYSGSNGIEELKAEKLEVRYNVRGLLKKDIELVVVDALKLKVDIAKFHKSEVPKEKKKQKTDLKALISKLRPWVINPEIRIFDLEVDVLKAGEPVAAIQWEDFTHLPKREQFEIKGFTAQNANRIDTEPQDISLTWAEHALSLNRWEVLPEMAIQETSLDWSADLKASTGLVIGDAILSAKVEKGISVELQQGELATSFIEQSLDIELPVEGLVNALQLDVENRNLPVAEWKVVADLNVRQASFKEYRLKQTKVSLLQEQEKYDVRLDGEINETRAQVRVDGVWNEGETWWKNTSANYSLNVPKVGKLPEVWVKDLPEIDYSGAGLKLSGAVLLEELAVKEGNAKGQISNLEVQQERMPTIFLDAKLLGDLVDAEVKLGSQESPFMEVDGKYALKAKSYDGSLRINASNPDWLNALMRFASQDARIKGATDISWSGSGNLNGDLFETEQNGKLTIEQLRMKIGDMPQIDLSTKVDYSFPNYINVEDLEVSEEEWEAKGGLSWNSKTVTIPGIKVYNIKEEMVQISGQIPYTLEVKSAKAFLAQKDAMKLNVSAQPITFQKLQKWTGDKIPKRIRGEAEADIQLSGSPAAPQIKGFLNLLRVRGIDPKFKEEVEANLDFKSVGEFVDAKVLLKESGAERLKVNGKIPFKPLDWVNDPKPALAALKKAPINADCDIRAFPMARIAAFVPQLEKVSGQVSAQGTFKGSIDDPKYDLKILGEIPQVELTSSEVGTIRNIKINSELTEKLLIANEVTAQINGGKFRISGTVDINDIKKPVFDMRALCDHSLVFRDDLLSVRANADLKLKGQMEDATISGTVGVTESLVYKDLELIPIGVPSSAVSKVKLPALTSNSSKELPIPEPFSAWKLEVTLKTEDPILIRGNIASGEVNGSVNVRGNLKQPIPNGAFYITDTKARLPFSILNIEKGEILFNEKTGLMSPRLRLPGTSSIAGYDVNLLVYGETSKPKTLLTSSPPLPESEIMSLIATGTTTTGLTNTDAVALKALQLFLLKLKDSRRIPFANQLSEAFLTGIDGLDLQVGQDDKFTGRTFTSAGVDLSEHWNFTTQIDEEQNARGLLVYLIRFK